MALDTFLYPLTFAAHSKIILCTVVVILKSYGSSTRLRVNSKGI